MQIKYFTPHDFDYVEAEIFFELDIYVDKWQFVYVI
jgi:hypothetical protein